ncbi:hypothetical protein bpr_II228 (plasmid) [Butyrivibrio proteoclasticus B316]|uniref:Uncharacterized protein n=1 Tax=Butyrivibrio proteoclasticus (strain ATCC 51982 / DSM 14932 / B316) TaxID=515622 RepID=E0S433_BUTPB|nr:hypothetical protein bpr_II228 [Butyrivibrio proteoclasticus B316]
MPRKQCLTCDSFEGNRDVIEGRVEGRIEGKAEAMEDLVQKLAKYFLETKSANETSEAIAMAKTL